MTIQFAAPERHSKHINGPIATVSGFPRSCRRCRRPRSTGTLTSQGQPQSNRKSATKQTVLLHNSTKIRTRRFEGNTVTHCEPALENELTCTLNPADALVDRECLDRPVQPASRL